jgi:hypothetical protein
MASPPTELNFPFFWGLLGRLAVKLLKERAHGEITLIFENGNIKIVRVNRVYLPNNLPDV